MAISYLVVWPERQMNERRNRVNVLPKSENENVSCQKGL